MVYNNIMENNSELDSDLDKEQLKQYDIYPDEAYAPMHDWLTTFEEYNTVPPIYLEKPLAPWDIAKLRGILNWHKSLQPTTTKVVPGHKEIIDNDVRVPRKMIELSRQIIDFIMPAEIEAKIDKLIKPMYKQEIKLSHYNYLDYNVDYGNDEYLPALQPHIDASNAILTFNYMIDGNIDWEVCVDEETYKLSPGDAIVFSAVNQVHWRPKRKWKKGEFVEIITLNYSPMDDWVFTGKLDPIHPFSRVMKRRQHGEEFQSTFAYARSFQKYQQDGLDIGIPLDKYGILIDDDGKPVDALVNEKTHGVPPVDFLFERANDPSQNIKYDLEVKDPKNKKYLK